MLRNRSRSKVSARFQWVTRSVWTSVLTLALSAPTAMAGPVGGNVTLGTASIDQATAGVTTVTQSSDRAVIQWDQFGVDAGEAVRFQQPSTSSIVVNRDISGQLSQINGELEANGQVFIQNPAGVMFGASAFVNVGGLVATDLDSLERIGETGDFVLTDSNVSTGGVTNEGVLRASTGGIALIGQQIVNSGELQTRAGDVQLIAASEVSVITGVDGVVGYDLTQPVRNKLPGNDFLIDNQASGVVVSIDGGDIVFSTQYVEDLLSGGRSVNQAGTYNVLGLVNQAGDIYISEVGVTETLVDDVIDEVIASDSSTSSTDVAETVATVDETSETLDNADALALAAADESEEGDEDGKNKKAGIKIDANYFAKLRKNHLDQLIPECDKLSSECDEQKDMKAFLGKLLVDGEL